MEYKLCPICGERIINEPNSMISHISEEHDDLIPMGQHPGEFLYLRTHNEQPRKCMICKKPTSWNEKTNKYNAFCSEKCKNEYVKIAKERMVKTYGKEYILDTPEMQKKMLSNRSISGIYHHSDGGTLTYTGTYERDFVELLDVFLQFPSNDIIMPSPHTYNYYYDNKQHFYFPDAFIPSLLLEIEIKDGGDNPNMHHKIQEVDKVKEKLKDDELIKQKDFHYIKIVNKDYKQFFSLIEKISNDNLTEKEKKEKIKIIP